MGLKESVERAWPGFVAAYFGAARPFDMPQDLADYLAGWIAGAAENECYVDFGEGQINVRNRGGRGDTVEFHWRGSAEFEGSDDDCLTVWADTMRNVRTVHGAPDWSDLVANGNWRHVNIRTVTQLQRVLGTIS